MRHFLTKSNELKTRIHRKTSPYGATRRRIAIFTLNLFICIIFGDEVEHLIQQPSREEEACDNKCVTEKQSLIELFQYNLYWQLATARSTRR